MSMTDPIADMLTRIRNSLLAGHQKVTMPGSRVKAEIARILQEQGFITGFAQEADDKQGLLHVQLKYGPHGEKVLSGLERVSKPGRRVYIGREEIPDLLGGMGVAILSTSQGILDGRSARRLGVGGEWICNVW
jgi:small subunit ribosomal protein S8